MNALLRELAERGSSPRTRQHVRATLRTALADAVRWGLVHANAAALSTPPRGESREIPVVSREDARAILGAVQGDRLEALYVVALSLGLRQGEALGLRWSDVDLERGTLTVRRALQKVKRGAVQCYELVEPKTRRSRRTIALPAPTVAALRAHRSRQLEERAALGVTKLRGKEWDLVFATEFGEPLHGPTVTRRLQALLRKAKLEVRRFHDLRHACATLLLAQGVPARVVMETLGHSTIAVTMNIYTHVMPELQRDAADRMGAFLTGSDS